VQSERGTSRVSETETGACAWTRHGLTVSSRGHADPLTMVPIRQLLEGAVLRGDILLHAAGAAWGGGALDARLSEAVRRAAGVLHRPRAGVVVLRVGVVRLDAQRVQQLTYSSTSKQSRFRGDSHLSKGLEVACMHGCMGAAERRGAHALA